MNGSAIHVSAADAIDQFRAAMLEAGIEPPDRIEGDGNRHRFGTNGKISDDSGWYVLHLDGIPAGHFGCWRSNISQKWVATIDRELTDDEKTANRKRMAELKAARDAEKQKRRDEARAKAAAIWDRAIPAPADHAYLLGKRVQRCGLRVHDGRLVVPMRDVAGELHSLQFIAGDGDKRFLTGGRVKGCYYAIGRPEGTLVVCEGFATGATIFEATGYAVTVAFNCGNLEPVARAMRDKFPEIRLIVAADNDECTDGNPGVTHGRAAAIAADALLAVPMFEPRYDWQSDFNDLGVGEGLDAVRTGIEAASQPEADPPSDSDASDRQRHDVGLTEDSVALEFSRQYADALRRVEEWSRWVRWDGTRWATDRTVEVMDFARKLCRKIAVDSDAKDAKALRAASFVAAVERLARSDRRHAAVPEQFDADPFVLNTPAGVVDLKTGSVAPHDPRLYVTKITAATLGGDCPTFRQFLIRITKGDAELQAFMQRMAGYCLTGSVREHALFFLFGCGANGKSTFVDVLAWLMGDYATVAAMEAFTATQGDRHPADLAALRGARLVTAHETEQGRRWDEARIKVLTGGDPITARFMRGDFFTYQPSFKIVVSGNHKPQLRSVDQAMRRRLHLVPFEAFIPPEERDPDLPAKLRAEAGGILAWAVAGCLDWQQQGLQPPKAVREATSEYLATQDSLQAWIDDCCEVGANKWDTAALLFGSWKRWAEAAGEYVGSQRVFADRLDAAGFQRERSKTARGYAGLAVRHTDDGANGEPWKRARDAW